MVIIRTILVFIFVQIIALFVSWMSGYDFDVRNGLVGYITAISIAAGLFFAWWYYESP